METPDHEKGNGMSPHFRPVLAQQGLRDVA